MLETGGCGMSNIPVPKGWQFWRIRGQAPSAQDYSQARASMLNGNDKLNGNLPYQLYSISFNPNYCSTTMPDTYHDIKERI